MKKFAVITFLICMPFLGMATGEDNKNKNKNKSNQPTTSTVDTGGSSNGNSGGANPPPGGSNLFNAGTTEWLEALMTVLGL